MINLLKVDQLIKRGSVERELLLDDFKRFYEVVVRSGISWLRSVIS